MKTDIIVLTKKNQIKAVRRIKQYTSAANDHAENGNQAGFKFWTKKAEHERNNLMKNLGISRDTPGEIPFLSTMSGTSEKVIILY